MIIANNTKIKYINTGISMISHGNIKREQKERFIELAGHKKTQLNPWYKDRLAVVPGTLNNAKNSCNPSVLKL